MTEVQSVLAYNIKKYRNTKGLTQEQLAEKAETSTNYLGSIETGKKYPSPQMIDKLAKADIETQVYSDYNEQFQAVAWLLLLFLLVELLIMERQNPLFNNIHLFEK